MRRTTLALPGAIILSSLLAGCGFIHEHFGRDDAAYRKSVQERPLEVPPDLDMPDTKGALTIPEAGSPSTTPSTAPTTESPQATGSSPVPAVNASAPPGVVAIGNALDVADGVESTYRRVGLALERGGEARILARDDANHSYSIETTGQATSKPGWFKRMITLGHAGNRTAAGVHLTVRVSATGSTSRVSVEGTSDEAGEDAARELLGMLRQRLS
ncbi:MAG TPA: hypothetical protein VFG55_08430 [Rhodanobacteraceae bacterium]|nr:hypothetical protein [Rhodanobacteraceae bacterium]